MSYPGYPGYPGYPQGGAPPSYQQQPPGAYPTPGYPQTSTPQYPGNMGQQAYPPNPVSGFPQPANPGYPSYPGYPPSTGYPSNTGYPSSTGYPPNTGYPPSTGYQPNTGYPPNTYPAPGSGHSAQGNPTVKPFPGFNARQDAEAIRKAMKGFGTNEEAILTIVANRTNAQRVEITTQFKTLHGKDLLKELKSELTGRFEQLTVALMTPLTQFYAQELREAVTGVGTDEDAVIEVLCTLDNHQIRTICAAYESLYRSSLENDLKKDTSGSFKRLMVSLCTANRDENSVVDTNACVQDAQALLAAGKLKFGTDESMFNAILCSRSYTSLRQIFTEYERLSGHPIEKAIKSEFSGDIERGLLAIVLSVRNKAAFFAERLHASLAGLGTKDRTLIRIVVTRCEVDMADIKLEFQVRYKKTLENFISGDASGDYKKCLIALIT